MDVWAAVVEFVSMMILARGGTESAAAQMAAIIMAGAGVMAYIMGEGLVDASAVKKTDDDSCVFKSQN